MVGPTVHLLIKRTDGSGPAVSAVGGFLISAFVTVFTAGKRLRLQQGAGSATGSRRIPERENCRTSGLPVRSALER